MRKLKNSTMKRTGTERRKERAQGAREIILSMREGGGGRVDNNDMTINMTRQCTVRDAEKQIYYD